MRTTNQHRSASTCKIYLQSEKALEGCEKELSTLESCTLSLAKDRSDEGALFKMAAGQTPRASPRTGLRMSSWLALVLLLNSMDSTGQALRMINLDVPETAIQGETHRLSCSFSLKSGDRPQKTVNLEEANTRRTWPQSNKYQHHLHRHYHRQQVAEGNDVDLELEQQQQQQDEQLYAIKWYKDEREFFRYLAQEWPRKQVLPLDGLYVDVEKSDNQTVVLRNVSLKTSGSFRCEVSTDAPTFVTKSIERKMHIFVLPSEGPSIKRLAPTGSQQAPLDKQARILALGEQLQLRCSSRESKPGAKLDWIINDTHNLSTWPLLGPKGEPLFRIDRKRLVHLPSQAHQANDAAYQSKQSTSGYQMYELDDNNQAASLAGYRHEQSELVISALDVVLDQLMETSTTSLNFTVDESLFQFLSNGSLSPSKAQAQQTTTATSIGANLARKQSSKSTQGNNSQAKWRKSAAHSSSRLTKSTEFTLKIKCVAQILHLSMSDEVKLRLVNKTKQSLADDESIARTEPQLQKKQNIVNSGICHIQQANPIVWLMATTTTLISLAWSVKTVII